MADQGIIGWLFLALLILCWSWLLYRVIEQIKDK